MNWLSAWSSLVRAGSDLRVLGGRGVFSVVFCVVKEAGDARRSARFCSERSSMSKRNYSYFYDVYWCFNAMYYCRSESVHWLHQRSARRAATTGGTETRHARIRAPERDARVTLPALLAMRLFATESSIGNTSCKTIHEPNQTKHRLQVEVHNPKGTNIHLRKVNCKLQSIKNLIKSCNSQNLTTTTNYEWKKRGYHKLIMNLKVYRIFCFP